MALLSQSLANQILDAFFDNAPFVPIEQYYISLHTASPGATGANEASGTDYARVETDAADWDAASGGQIDNGAAVDFPTPGAGGWNEVAFFGIWDAPTGGNYQFGGVLPIPKTINEGDGVSFPAGALVVSLT